MQQSAALRIGYLPKVVTLIELCGPSRKAQLLHHVWDPLTSKNMALIRALLMCLDLPIRWSAGSAIGLYLKTVTTAGVRCVRIVKRPPAATSLVAAIAHSLRR